MLCLCLYPVLPAGVDNTPVSAQEVTNQNRKLVQPGGLSTIEYLVGSD